MDFSPFVYENLQALKTDNRNAVSSKTDDYTDMDGPRDETCTIAGGIEGFSTKKTTMHESSTLVKPKIQEMRTTRHTSLILLTHGIVPLHVKKGKIIPRH
jgi:hypothetical protein